MKPLLVISLGRSGSTLLMQLLANHPDIVAHRAYPLELQLFTMATFPYHPNNVRLRDRQYLPFEQDEFMRERYRATGRLTTEDVARVYRTIGRDKDPLYIAEKFDPSYDLEAVRAAFPDMKFIVLVRDPRDVLMSARATDRKRGYRGFGGSDHETDRQVVMRYRKFVLRMLGWTQRYGGLTIRYEDLVAHAKPTLAQVFRWLELPGDPATVTACVTRAASTRVEAHSTAPSDERSIGRWKAEMPGATQAAYQRHMGPLLARMGY